MDCSEVSATGLGVATEIMVFALLFLAGINARAHGRRWFWTFVVGSFAGLCVEVLLSNLGGSRYKYGCSFALNLFNTPLSVGLGWGLVIYTATWTAQRLRLDSVWASSLIAGVLGVTLDLSLDPVAHSLRFWEWVEVEGMPAGATLYGVPFDNFVAWVALISIYEGLTRKGFHWRNARQAETPAPRLPGQAAAASKEFWDWLIPVLAVAFAAMVFIGLRTVAPALYAWLGKNSHPALGEAIVFVVMLLLGLYLFWYHVLKSPRDARVNVVVLVIVTWFHAWNFLLLVLSGHWKDATGLLVLIPINLVSGFVAFVWPSLDAFVGLRKRSQKFDASADGVPEIGHETLTSYDGTRVQAQICRPRTEAQLRAVLAFARAANTQVTFRTGGHAFDTQSLNQKLVISLEKLNTIQLSGDNETVTVGAGARWGEILKTTLPLGRVPYVMVTDSTAAAGGTLSSHSVARFSASFGREGKFVESIVLVTPDGVRRECSRTQEPQLFRAAIGGLGYVGAIISITHKLLKVPVGAKIKTEFQTVSTLASTGKRIRGAETLAKGLSNLVRNDGSNRGNDVALSAALNMRGKRPHLGLLATSRYVDPSESGPWSIFHSPNSFGHMVTQLAAFVPMLRALGYWFTYRSYVKPRTRVDDTFGYTFFEDGHGRARKILQVIGCPVPIVQQTFIIPTSDEVGGETTLVEFLLAADKLLDDRNLDPALVDVLYLPKDPDDDGFVLSSTKNQDGYAVTFTFESLWDDLSAERHALFDLSHLCQTHGGWVHLVKNVCADSKIIEKSYRDALAEMARVRSQHSAELIRNHFAERVMPGLVKTP